MSENFKRIYIPKKNQEIKTSYSKVPHVVMRDVQAKLSGSEWKLFTLIWDYTLGTTTRTWIPISYSNLAKKTGLSYRTIANIIKSLREKEIIEVLSCKSRKNKWMYNTYRIKPGILDIEKSTF